MDQIERPAPPEPGPIASRISREVVQLHAQLFGRGPTRAKTHLAGDYALCLLEDVFTAAEKTLIKAGNSDQVKVTRAAFQDAVGKEFIAIAEAATGRPVRTLISQVDVETEMAVELFLFDPTGGRRMSEAGGADATAISDEIRREMLQVHEEAYGAGATNVEVHLAEDTVIVVIDVELSRAEHTLLDAGHPEAVKGMREGFQSAIAPTFGAIVERATGRTVSSFLSAMCMEPLYSVELFRLHPKSSD